MLRIVLRRVLLSLKKNRHWRKRWVVDSISWPQLHKGFNVCWKLSLNLCSLKWLKPSLSLVISLIPLGLRISKTEFGEGRMKLSIFSLKTDILLEFLRLGSKLFHSMIAEGKKEILKKLCFVLIRGILLSCYIEKFLLQFSGKIVFKIFKCCSWLRFTKIGIMQSIIDLILNLPNFSANFGNRCGQLLLVE